MKSRWTKRQKGAWTKFGTHLKLDATRRKGNRGETFERRRVSGVAAIHLKAFSNCVKLYFHLSFSPTCPSGQGFNQEHTRAQRFLTLRDADAINE